MIDKTQNRLYTLKRPVIFAHRGASAYAPENTLAAFELAIKQNTPAVELDVMLTKDQKVVVFHDLSIERVTGIKGNIRQMTLAEVKKLDVGSYFDSAFEGERIPTLEEVFDFIRDKLLINIELKNYLTPFDPLPELVASLVEKWQLQASVFFSSFNPIALIRIKRQLPQVPIALLAPEGKLGWPARSRLGELCRYQAIHPHYSDVNAKFIALHHRKGHLINAYTVNNVSTMRLLFDLGVDGVFTDDPPLAQTLLNTLHYPGERKNDSS
ncbi:MAG: glycerophosphodiester phosphodiesterase family protein [Anaerolineales bacterium]|nr:hypothetical protein [Anaerolineales bacterium]MCS7247975.1 hypothetical protein [Anaerolineales bacterium]MDW8161787.1 glycerophosphodiester phosphodiesterase family protein [Anaerolineales bacterium]MDW8445712.1 glycerophosphodiester phosphodiesterase family protein [Anaerolineales bacterium]